LAEGRTRCVIIENSSASGKMPMPICRLAKRRKIMFGGMEVDGW
jgi:hypothetical protein